MIYYIESPSTGLIKIGTSQNIPKRMKQLEPGARLLATEPGSFKEEKSIHARFCADRDQVGEWFRPSPKLMDYIRSLPSEHEMDTVNYIRITLDGDLNHRLEQAAKAMRRTPYNQILDFIERGIEAVESGVYDLPTHMRRPSKPYFEPYDMPPEAE